MTRLQKFVEIGEGSCRHVYVLRPSSLPSADEGKEWYPVEKFNAAEEQLEDPSLKVVFKMAVEEGCAVDNENDEGLKKGKQDARKDLVWMAQNRKQGAWSYKEDRRLLELAKHSRPAEEMANLMNRSPDAIRKMAIRLGVSVNNNPRQSVADAKLKATRKSASAGGWPKGK